MIIRRIGNNTAGKRLGADGQSAPKTKDEDEEN
jgi:hypothetical protein